MATAQAIYQIHTPIHGSALCVGRFLRVIGPPPEWVERHAARFLGTLPIPADDPSIWPVDAQAEAREIAAAIPTPPKPPYRLEGLKKAFDLKTDAQATELVALLGLKGYYRDNTDGAHKGEKVYGRRQEWYANDVDRGVELIRRLFPNALRTK